MLPELQEGFQAILPTMLASGPSLVLKHVLIFSAQSVDFACIVSLDFPQQPASSARWHRPILQMQKLMRGLPSVLIPRGPLFLPHDPLPALPPGSVTKPLLEYN